MFDFLLGPVGRFCGIAMVVTGCVRGKRARVTT